MSEKKISPGLKSALDLGPVVLFFLAFFFLKADSYTISGREYGKFIVVTAMFIPVLFASIGALWYLTGMNIAVTTMNLPYSRPPMV